MEEVDKIIVHSLKGVGCDLDEDVQSLRSFSTEMIVEAVVRCLRVINNDTELSTSLPGGMSAKFRVGTSLANALVDLGYRGEIGYQTFLYSNETDIRRVLMFLIEKLPKESEEGGEEILGSSALLQRAISAEVTKRLRSAWGPAYLRVNGISWRGSPPSWAQEDEGSFQQFHSRNLTIPQDTTDISKAIPKGTKRYFEGFLPFVTNFPPRHSDVSPSVLEHNGCCVTAQQEWETEWNRSGLASGLTEVGYRSKKKQKILKRVGDQLRQSMQKAKAADAASDNQNLQQYIDTLSGRLGTSRTKGSRFTHTEKLQFAQDDKAVAQLGGDTARADTEEDLQAKREDEINQLNEELNNLTNELEKLELNCQKFKTNMQQMEDQINQQEVKNSTEEESFVVKKRTMDLLPNAAENISKLQSVVESSTQRLVGLANQWEQHRAPLLLQYRELKDINSQKQSEAQEKLEQIKEFREKMKLVADEARGKEELYKQLLSEYERMTKDVNRSAYTRKIMEILSNIKKQKDGIEKVLIDTRFIQKEINQLSGKLDRTFMVTDELIFRDAKKDEAVKKAYKCLAALHENCDLLIATVEDTGGIMREIRELEDQIEVESKKKVLANLQKITDDFQQMKKENTSLMSKLKG